MNEDPYSLRCTFDSITHFFHHNARLTSWRTLMSYLVLSRNGEESLNKFSIPDPNPDLDHLIGGPSQGYTPSCVIKSS